uniref:Uncharacterized protein n=1 Tax=Pelusios castaneus TaxID=367368 RepID=A0A8C8S0T1_9SAUR
TGGAWHAPQRAGQSPAHPAPMLFRMYLFNITSLLYFHTVLLNFLHLITVPVFASYPEPCNSEECLTLLARLLKVRNTTIDPCEDFYGYACGNWEASYPHRVAMESSNVFEVLLEENQLILKRLIEVPELRDGGSAKAKAIRFYHSCMDTQQIEAEGAQPLENLINQIGGWNFTNVGEKTDFNQTLQTLMGKYSTFPFFRAFVGPIFSDPSTNIIQIDHPEFEMPPETLVLGMGFKSQVVREYFSYLMKLGTLLGGPENVTSNFISFTLSFISNLQKEVTPFEERQERRMLFYRTTIRELQKEAPAIDWLSCLQAAFHPVQLNSSQPIAVHDMDYLKGMSRLIGKWQKGRVLQIYMILCLVRTLSPALDSRFHDAHSDLLEKLHGKIGVSGLVSQFPFNSQQPPWELHRSLFFLFSFSVSSWEVYPWSVHSYYSLRHHFVVFPAGMFRSPFFHVDFPSAVNFGAMGVIMAHELLHMFYDYVLPESCPECNRDALRQGIDCLVEQYESYSVQGLRVNGTFTLLENAADTGGLAIAYQAYKNWLKKQKREKNLPRSGLSHYQLFYLSFAQVINSLAFLHRDPHSPLPLRVRGSLSNTHDFARHFRCSSTSAMNPAFRCYIW